METKLKWIEDREKVEVMKYSGDEINSASVPSLCKIHKRTNESNWNERIAAKRIIYEGDAPTVPVIFVNCWHELLPANKSSNTFNYKATVHAERSW